MLARLGNVLYWAGCRLRHRAVPLAVLTTINALCLPAWLFFGVALVVFLRIRRRIRRARWEAYIREECALYLEEVLLAGG